MDGQFAVPGGQPVPEVVVGRKLDGLLWCDQQNIYGRAAVHAEVAFGAICLLEAVQH